MLYREIIAVCSQNHTKLINTLCGQNVELLNVKLAVHIATTGPENADVQEELCRTLRARFKGQYTISARLQGHCTKTSDINYIWFHVCMCVSPATVLAAFCMRHARNDTACTDRRTVTVTHCLSLHRQFVTNSHFNCNMINGGPSVVRHADGSQAPYPQHSSYCAPSRPPLTYPLAHTPPRTPTYHCDVTFTRFQAVWPQNLMRNRCYSLAYSIKAAAMFNESQYCQYTKRNEN